MKLYNTLTKSIQELEPIKENKINFFVCGPTVYDYAHLGHAKTYIQFDFIVKYLRSQGYDVTYIMNITDIDDKIIKRAKEQNIEPLELSKKFAPTFYEDMLSLGNTSVTKYALATDYIDAMVKQIQILLSKGYAYRTNDGIYYEISKFKNYGKLSGRTEIKEYDAVTRIDSSAQKRGWNDFCLWKDYEEGEPYWETAIGKGRPGWHIEDTAITETEFGQQYDIHGGGADLMFPHHEAEIAQMEAASGKSPLVNYWMHVGFLNVNSKKMGKSLGNFKTIREVLQNFDYKTLRYFFLSSHYRSQIDFTDEALEAAKNGVKRINEFLFKLDPTWISDREQNEVNALKTEVTNYLNNDVNSAQALGAIFEFIKKHNTDEKVGKAVYDYFKELNEFFGFMSLVSESENNEIDKLIKLRNELREKGEFSKADELRDKLLKQKIVIYDDKNGTRWRKAN